MGSFMQTDSREHQVLHAVARCVGALTVASETGSSEDYRKALELMREQQDVRSDIIDALIEATKNTMARIGVRGRAQQMEALRYQGLGTTEQAHYATGAD